MAGSERRGPGRAARRATSWAFSEAEHESDPSPGAAGPAGRLRRRRGAPGEAAVRRREREQRKERQALEKRRRRRGAVPAADGVVGTAGAWEVAKVPEVYFHGLSPGLVKDPGSDGWVKVLSSLDCKYSCEPQAIPCSVTWRRNMLNPLSTPGEVKTKEEKEVFVLVEPEDFLKRLFSLTQSFVNAPSVSPDLNQLLSLAGLEGSSTKTYSLAVVGLDAYRWYCKREQGRQQALSPGKQGPSSRPGPKLSMTQEEVLEALVVLQLWGNIKVLFLDMWQEFRQHVSALTKAIANCLYKRQLESQELPFCIAGAWASRAVEKDGTGLWQVWKRQIQQFNRVSPATAAAIAEAYPSPTLLLQAYKECSTEDEKQLLLSDIPVKLDVGGRDRYVGPDLSRRIYLFVISTDPNLILDLST
ncbi:LOW QUALITY PROTEIN: putative crossover junction endonuclease EME2 [Cariama cristata]